MWTKFILARVLIMSLTTIVLGALLIKSYKFQGNNKSHNCDISNCTSTNETRSIDTNIPCCSNNHTILSPERKKRFLIFSGNGVVKFVFGISFPIKLADRQRSLSMFYNFHVQYMPPTRPVYWWSLFNSSTFAARAFDSHPPLQHITDNPRLAFDTSRTYIYTIIENFLRRNGKSGKDCLLQAICLAVRQPFDESSNSGIFEALLNSILIPILPNVSYRYLDAVKLGRSSVDCMKVFSDCAENTNWLKTISYLV